jgi:hypothetical protein
VGGRDGRQCQLNGGDFGTLNRFTVLIQFEYAFLAKLLLSLEITGRNQHLNSLRNVKGESS